MLTSFFVEMKGLNVRVFLNMNKNQEYPEEETLNGTNES